MKTSAQALKSLLDRSKVGKEGVVPRDKPLTNDEAEDLLKLTMEYNKTTKRSFIVKHVYAGEFDWEGFQKEVDAIATSTRNRLALLVGVTNLPSLLEHEIKAHIAQ